MESITITLGNGQRVDNFNILEGEVIKITDAPRWCLVVKGVTNDISETTITSTMKYIPSPKSQLKHLSYFTKIKFPIFSVK